MVDPPFRGENRADDHPQGDIRIGPAVRARGVQGVRAVPAVGARDVRPRLRRVGRLLRPPPAREVRRTTAPARSTTTTSARAASGSRRWSPRRTSRPGSVDHTLYDHTVDHAVPRVAVPRRARGTARARRTSDKWWLTERDRNAHNIGGALGLEKPEPRPRLRHRPRPATSPPRTAPRRCSGAALGGPGRQPALARSSRRSPPRSSPTRRPGRGSRACCPGTGSRSSTTTTTAPAYDVELTRRATRRVDAGRAARPRSRTPRPGRSITSRTGRTCVHLPDDLADRRADQLAVLRAVDPAVGVAHEHELQRHREVAGRVLALPRVGPRGAQLAGRLPASASGTGPCRATSPRAASRCTSGGHVGSRRR